MHLFSVCLVCGVNCVIAKGTVTAGMVLALASLPPSLCFNAARVVDDAVPDNGCTYCNRFCACVGNHNKNTIAKAIIFFMGPALVILFDCIGVALLYIL